MLQTSSQFDDPVTGQTDLQVNDLNGGNPNLEPEKSKQWSLGLVFQPIAPLSIGLDYFNIEVTTSSRSRRRRKSCRRTRSATRRMPDW